MKLRVVVFLLLALLSAGLAADPLFEVLQDHDKGRKVNAIVLRDKDGKYILATKDGISVRPKGRMQRYGKFTSETGRMNDVLGSIESWIRRSRFPQALEKLPQLDSALADFQSVYDLKIRSSATPENYRQSLKVALEYYKTQRESVQPTIRTLELSRKLKIAIDELNPRRPFNAEAFVNFVTYYKELREIGKTIDIAEPEKQEAMELAADKWASLERRVVQLALKNVPDTWDVTKATELLGVLKRAAAVNPEVGTIQTLMADALIEEAVKYSNTIKDVVGKSYSFTKGPNINRRGLGKAESQLRKINTGLLFVSTKMFGTHGREASDALRKRIAKNREAIKAAQEVYNSYLKMINKYRTVDSLGRRRLYDEAIAAIDDVRAQAKALGLYDDRFKKDLEQRVLEYQGRALLAALRNPTSDKRSDVEELIKAGEAYFKANNNSPSLQMLSFTDMRKHLEQLKQYLTFDTTFQKVRQENELASWKKLELLQSLQAMVIDDQNVLHAIGKQAYETFLNQDADAIYQAAAADFVNKKWDLKSNTNQRIFLELISWQQSRGRASEAADLIALAYDAVKPTETGFLKRLTSLDIGGALQISKTDLDKSEAIFTRVRTRFPELFKQNNTQERLLEVLKKQAEAADQAGNTQQAINIYQRICNTSPDFASRNRVFYALFKLLPKSNPELLADNEKRRDFLNAYCQRFGYRMNDVELLKQETAAISSEFLTSWDTEKKPEEAVDFFLMLHSNYPDLVKEAKLLDSLFKEIRQRIFALRQKVTRSEDTLARAPTVTVPQGILNTLEKLMIPDLRYYVEKHRLDAALVELKKAKALEYMALGSFSQAFDLLEEVQKQFPAISEQYKVGEMMEQKRSDLLLEKVCKPLGIRRKMDKAFGDFPALYIDMGALIGWVLFFFIYLLNAFSRGRQTGQMGYMLKHFLVVLGTFILFMALFVGVGNMHHFSAVILSLIIPTIVFNIIAIATFNFFPLVYKRRYVGLQRALINLPVLGPKFEGLKNKVERQQEDLGLLKDPWAYRIEQFSRLENKEEAVASLEEVLGKIDEGKTPKLADKRPRVLYLLGQALYALGKLEPARSRLTEFATHDEKHLDAQRLLSEINFKLEDFEGAIPHLKFCLAHGVNDDSVWYQLGRSYFETTKFKSAFKCFEAIKDPNRDSLFFKARCLARLGDRDKSVACYQELLKDEPHDGRVLYSLASSFALMGQDVKAFKVIDLINEDTPYYPHAVGLQGSILLRNSKDSKAEEFFNKALELDSQLVPALHGLGQLLMEKGDLDGARKKFEQILEIEPFNAAAAFHLGAVREQQGEQNAIDLFLKAVEDPQLQPLASIHLARIKFQEQAYEDVVTYYKDAGTLEISARDHYMNSFSGIETGEVETIRDSLVKLSAAVNREKEPKQAQFAAKALMTLGEKFLDSGIYKHAIMCFSEVKKSNALGADEAQLIERLISEASFRTAYELLRDDHIDKALKINESLASLPEEMGFSAKVAHQNALINLKSKNYEAALQVLTKAGDDGTPHPRLSYHKAIAQLGSGNTAAAQALLAEIEDEDGLPAYITAGKGMVEAYILAENNQVKEAEQRLADTPLPPEGTPESDYVRSRILLTRADYLCRIHDSTRLQFLMKDMTENEKADVAYMQAVASLEGGGQISNVVKNLKPFVDKSKDGQLLYALLTVRLARQLVDEDNLERALTLLLDACETNEALKPVVYHLQMHGALDDTESLQSVQTAVKLLDYIREKITLPGLLNMILHNLFILKLKYPLLLEEAGHTQNALSAWKEFQTFKQSLFVNNLEFWNGRVMRLSDEGAPLQPLVQKEVDHIVSDFHTNVMLPTYIGCALTCLQSDNPESLGQYINHVIALGKAEDKVKEFTQRLGITAKHYSESLSKDDPLTKTWGYVIGYLMIQIYVREAMKPGEKSPLRSQLENYLEVRNHYDSPSSFLKARKVFNTKILDALQKGIEGKFSKGGDMLEKCITNVPPGVKLDQQLEAALWTIREQARKPGAASDEDINLAQEFERVYQRVLNFSVQRGG